MRSTFLTYQRNNQTESRRSILLSSASLPPWPLGTISLLLYVFCICNVVINELTSFFFCTSDFVMLLLLWFDAERTREFRRGRREARRRRKCISFLLEFFFFLFLRSSFADFITNWFIAGLIPSQRRIGMMLRPRPFSTPGTSGKH